MPSATASTSVLSASTAVSARSSLPATFRRSAAAASVSISLGATRRSGQFDSSAGLGAASLGHLHRTPPTHRGTATDGRARLAPGRPAPPGSPARCPVALPRFPPAACRSAAARRAKAPRRVVTDADRVARTPPAAILPAAAPAPSARPRHCPRPVSPSARPCSPPHARLQCRAGYQLPHAGGSGNAPAGRSYRPGSRLSAARYLTRPARGAWRERVGVGSRSLAAASGSAADGAPQSVQPERRRGAAPPGRSRTPPLSIPLLRRTGVTRAAPRGAAVNPSSPPHPLTRDADDPVPVGRMLVGVRDPHEERIVEKPPDELHADRETRRRLAHGEGERRVASVVEGLNPSRAKTKLIGIPATAM